MASQRSQSYWTLTTAKQSTMDAVLLSSPATAPVHDPAVSGVSRSRKSTRTSAAWTPSETDDSMASSWMCKIGLIDDRQAGCFACGLVDRVEREHGAADIEDADHDQDEDRHDQGELDQSTGRGGLD